MLSFTCKTEHLRLPLPNTVETAKVLLKNKKPETASNDRLAKPVGDENQSFSAVSGNQSKRFVLLALNSRHPLALFFYEVGLEFELDRSFLFLFS